MEIPPSSLLNYVKWLLAGFLAFLILIWVLQELTVVKILRYVILFMGTNYSAHFCVSTILIFVVF
jgi:hypothetical protein